MIIVFSVALIVILLVMADNFRFVFGFLLYICSYRKRKCLKPKLLTKTKNNVPADPGDPKTLE
jgi:hypothetical protein